MLTIGNSAGGKEANYFDQAVQRCIGVVLATAAGLTAVFAPLTTRLYRRG